MKTGLIVVDHGSRRDRANEMLEEVTALVQELADVHFVCVTHAHMELATPSIEEAVAYCVAQGAEHIVISLFFLSPGRHAREDIPLLAKEAVSRFPGVGLSISAPLGVDARLAQLLLQRANEALNSE